MIKGEINEYYLYRWAEDVFHGLLRKPRKVDSRSLNRALEEAVSDTLGEHIVDILNATYNEKELSEILIILKEFATSRWVKDLIISILDHFLDDNKKDQQNLEMAKQELGN